uniref:OCIA domain-containing protein n=1 Tax=Monopterus albus TaxID=43700 RepID=A0A3Q3JV31_MONAL|nr:OCIA domain-containing protein 2 isoform X2 [Monopterus albus]
MSSEKSGDTITVETAAATGPAALKWGFKCPLSDPNIQRDDVRKVWKECQEESFWYRALPLSLGSMAVTGGLIYKGIWSSSKRFGPFPKLAVAGILGYALGKASYVGTCQNKFQKLGVSVGPGFGPWPGPGRRSCNHVCEECKKTAHTAPAEEMKS